MYKALLEGTQPSANNTTGSFRRGRAFKKNGPVGEWKHYTTSDGEMFFSPKLKEDTSVPLTSNQFEAMIAFVKPEHYSNKGSVRFKKIEKPIFSMDWNKGEIVENKKKNNYEFGIEFSDGIFVFDIKRKTQTHYETLADSMFTLGYFAIPTVIETTESDAFSVVHLFNADNKSFFQTINITMAILGFCTEDQEWRDILKGTEDHICFSTKKFIKKKEKKKDRFEAVTHVVEMDLDGEFCFDENNHLKQEGFNPVSEDCTVFCKEWADNFKVDNLFSNRVYSHGLATGYTFDEMDVIKKSELQPNWEICCSEKTQLLGGVGLYVMGRAIMVSSGDLFTIKSDNGRFLNLSMGYCRSENVKYELKEYLEDVQNHGHSEIVLDQIRIVGVWCKDDNYLDVAEHIAKVNNVKLYKKNK